MQLYLSSYRIGDAADVLRRMAAGRTLGLVPNAADHLEPAERTASNAEVLDEVRAAGLEAEVLDLRDYFGAPDALEARLRELRGVWVRGGNAFVLRQAMRHSGLDVVLGRLAAADFLYAGYSAGICVLGPTLEGLHRVDDPEARPYGDAETIWAGLGLLDRLLLPHYRSDHPESAAVDRAVAYCRTHAVPFRTLRDGEVIVADDLKASASS